MAGICFCIRTALMASHRFWDRAGSLQRRISRLGPGCCGGGRATVDTDGATDTGAATAVTGISVVSTAVVGGAPTPPPMESIMGKTKN